MVHPSLQFDREALAAICRKYGIRELCIFGSATRDDFGPLSDVDLLAEYEHGRRLTFDDYLDLHDDLERFFEREIDLVDGRESLINPYRRAAILPSLVRLYGA